MTKIKSKERLFKLKEAAEKLGVTTHTIRVWDSLGKIKTERTKGGHRLVSQKEIDRVNAFRRPDKV